MSVCRDNKIACIHAASMNHQQLAAMNQNLLIQAVIAVDSNIIIHGCNVLISLDGLKNYFTQKYLGEQNRIWLDSLVSICEGNEKVSLALNALMINNV